MLFNSGRGYYCVNICILWKYPRFVDIIRISFIYPHFVYISVFRGSIHVLCILSTFHGNIHVPWILSAFCVCIHILWIISALRGNVHILWILSKLRTLYLPHFNHLVKVTGAYQFHKKYYFAHCLDQCGIFCWCGT